MVYQLVREEQRSDLWSNPRVPSVPKWSPEDEESYSDVWYVKYDLKFEKPTALCNEILKRLDDGLLPIKEISEFNLIARISNDTTAWVLSVKPIGEISDELARRLSSVSEETS